MFVWVDGLQILNLFVSFSVNLICGRIRTDRQYSSVWKHWLKEKRNPTHKKKLSFYNSQDANK